ncbi:MAG: beta-lactamase family protein, partial [Gemmatimonadetes bacterium]|nr:beta-lactamase family protein [Gemmatimonadota bacterium]
MSLLRPAAVLPLLVCLSASAAAQQPERLSTGRSYEGTLAAGQSRTFLLPLDSGRFAAGVAMQHGIDFDVTIVGPAGDTLGKFDSPNGTEGAEPFQVISKTRGDHRVILAALPEANGSGRYELTLRLLPPVATTPAGKVEQLLFARGPRDPGAVIAVVRGGKIVYQKAWGLANLAHQVPFTLGTRTNIGSTSKQFTAFAILLLASQGKLSLDDDVRKHIPELPDLGATVRIRHLLSHTSGYREFLNALLMGGLRLDQGEYIDRAEIIAIVQRQPALQNQPGAEFNYNNTGFALLATIVERVGGKPFPQWLEENVFRPIGMTGTMVRASNTAVVPGSAQGYAADAAGGWREVGDIGASMGAGGIYTTVGDLALWLRNFRTGQVGAPAFLAQMTTRFVLNGGDTTGYGMGLFVDRWRGLRRYQHGGADAAHRSQLIYFPELDAGVIVDSNDAAFNAGGIADQVAAIFFADKLTPAPALAPANATPAAAPFDVAKFDAYAGRYELTEAPGFVLTISRAGPQLLGQATGPPQIPLTAP